MKRVFALILSLVTLLSLVACAAAPVETTAPATEPETQPTEPVDDYDYPEIKGCAVMCSGNVNSQTRLELTDMLCAYLGIKSNMIYIGYIG